MEPLEESLEECLTKLERAMDPENPLDSHPEPHPDDHHVLQTPQAFWEFVQSSSSSQSEGGKPEAEEAAQDGSDQVDRLNGGHGDSRLGLGLGLGLGSDLDDSLHVQMDKLRDYLSHCDGLRSRLRSAVDLLVDLESQHDLVSTKTNSLHETCKKLLAEQSAFDNVVTEIEAPLTYLRELDRISLLFGVSISSPLNPNTRMNGNMNRNTQHKHQGRQLPLHPDSTAFNAALRRVDECIDYVESNPQFRDYRAYASKFSELYTRGLSLLKEHICKAIVSMVESAKAGLEMQGNTSTQLGIEGTTQYSLLYVRFHVLAGQLKPCIAQLESRADKDEALQQLRECHESLCVNRLSILKSVVSESSEITSPSGLIPKMRLASPYLIRLCNLEYHLFCSFFDPVFTPASPVTSDQREDAYTTLIRSCCEGFYDVVRPLIIQQRDIDTLCECIRVVEGEVLDAQVAAAGPGVSAFRSIVEQILHDLQERLFYCTSLYIQAAILGFAPTEEDLDYPRKLRQAVDDKRSSSGNGEAEGKSKRVEQDLMYLGWYKSLENTLMCLSKVFRCIEAQTFDEITQEAIMACTSSLSSASELIAMKQSRLDGDLFLVKHLLILREQITPFNSDLRVKQKHLDYKPTFDAFAEFLSHSRQVFAINRQNPLIELFARGVPRIAEDEVDCKKDLEGKLREACDKFILRAYQKTLVTLVPFLQRAVTLTVSPAAATPSPPLAAQDFALPAKLLVLLKQNQESIPASLTEISELMGVYLVNEQTHAILFQPIKTNIFARLTELSAIINEHYAQAEEFQQMVELVSAMRASTSQVGIPSRNAKGPNDQNVKDKDQDMDADMAKTRSPTEEGETTKVAAAEKAEGVEGGEGWSGRVVMREHTTTTTFFHR